jgi:hypothetical protein
MEPSPYSGDEVEEVVVAMGKDCSVKSNKVLDIFTAHKTSVHFKAVLRIGHDHDLSTAMSEGVFKNAWH